MVISSLEQVGERLDTLEKGVSKGGTLPQGDLQVIRVRYACKVGGGGGLCHRSRVADPDPHDFGSPDPHPDPDPLVRGMDPRIQIRIRIHTKMSWIRNTSDNKRMGCK